MASQNESIMFKGKQMVCKISLILLGVAFEYLSKHCDEMKKEVSDIEDGLVFSLGFLSGDPAVAIKVENGELKYLGQGTQGATLKFLFKNVDTALPMFLGLLGSDVAFAEHRLVLHGSLFQAGQVNRCMAIVVKYLFPGIMLSGITKRKPKMDASEILLKVRVNALIGPLLAMNISK
jgi:hypothetical protein